jgi:hypothetical protein
MWIFTKDGFFSAVQHRKNKDYLMIRARTKMDIQQLAYSLGTILGKTVKYVDSRDGFSDYGFRLTCSKRLWGRYLDKSAKEIDYDNFKSGMKPYVTPKRMEQLHEIWYVMLEPDNTAYGRAAFRYVR